VEEVVVGDQGVVAEGVLVGQGVDLEVPKATTCVLTYYFPDQVVPEGSEVEDNSKLMISHTVTFTFNLIKVLQTNDTTNMIHHTKRTV